MDRKRIKEALEKHTERPSPSTSRGASREKELLAAGKITTQIGKVPKVSDVGEDLAVRRPLLLLFVVFRIACFCQNDAAPVILVVEEIIWCTVIACLWEATCVVPPCFQ